MGGTDAWLMGIMDGPRDVAVGGPEPGMKPGGGMGGPTGKAVLCSEAAVIGGLDGTG